MPVRTETRAEKAKRLLDTGSISALVDLGNVASALVDGDHGLYNTIIFPDGTFQCECDWGRYHGRTQDRCSHALALQLRLKETEI